MLSKRSQTQKTISTYFLSYVEWRLNYTYTCDTKTEGRLREGRKPSRGRKEGWGRIAGLNLNIIIE